jgi:hypothetical protein
MDSDKAGAGTGAYVQMVHGPTGLCASVPASPSGARPLYENT